MCLLFKAFSLAFQNKQEQGSGVCHLDTRILHCMLTEILFLALGKVVGGGELWPAPHLVSFTLFCCLRCKNKMWALGGGGRGLVQNSYKALCGGSAGAFTLKCIQILLGDGYGGEEQKYSFAYSWRASSLHCLSLNWMFLKAKSGLLDDFIWCEALCGGKGGALVKGKRGAKVATN